MTNMFFSFNKLNNMDIDKMVNHKIAKLSGIIKRQIYQIISEEGLDITPEQWVLLSIYGKTMVRLLVI